MLAKNLLEAAGNATQASYIEDVFSTYLYPSVSGNNQIINGIDLSGKGGLVWIKGRTRAANHYLLDTVRGSSLGVSNTLSSNTTTAQTSGPNLDWVQFNNNGFTAKAVVGGGELGTNPYYGDMASWTFRKQPKFFDVVTYTGDGTNNRVIAHSLGSTPGCVIVKRTSNVENWNVWHRSASGNLQLNATAAATDFNNWYPTGMTSTTFGVAEINAGNTNDVGSVYVAYLFAHNAGGFGATGTDNVISCGSFTSTGSALSVNLGYEPQWLLFKPSSGAGNWELVDSMRGFQVDRNGSTVGLEPNSSAAESALGLVGPTSTGFTFDNGGSGTTYIYIAIRRGPMKTPTTGTSVYNAIARTGTGAAATVTGVGFPPDMSMTKRLNGTSTTPALLDRLRGAPAALYPTSTGAEAIDTTIATSFNMDGITFGDQSGVNASTFTYINHFFRRAPGFFDVVCYTGTGASTTVAHNLAAVPELMIVKKRSATGYWIVYSQTLGIGNYLILNDAGGANASGLWGGVSPTSTTFSLGTNANINETGSTFVWYGFASTAGVSKVGSYTGTGAAQTINCGFAGGARFVMVKSTSTTGDWIIVDTARGLVTGNDPTLALNTTAAEVTTNDWFDPASVGFELSSVAGNLANTSGVSYIFWAIA